MTLEVGYARFTGVLLTEPKFLVFLYDALSWDWQLDLVSRCVSFGSRVASLCCVHYCRDAMSVTMRCLTFGQMVVIVCASFW